MKEYYCGRNVATSQNFLGAILLCCRFDHYLILPRLLIFERAKSLLWRGCCYNDDEDIPGRYSLFYVYN